MNGKNMALKSGDDDDDDDDEERRMKILCCDVDEYCYVGHHLTKTHVKGNV
jgi:hypothetical protein